MDVLAPRGWHCIEMYGSGGAFLLVTPEPHSADELQTFPSHRAFVRQVIREGMEPARNFPFGPYLADRLTRHGRSEVEFTTPPGRAGMGTVMDRLSPSGMPVSGMARLATQDGVTLLDVRLLAGSRPLTAAIIRFSRGR